MTTDTLSPRCELCGRDQVALPYRSWDELRVGQCCVIESLALKFPGEEETAEEAGRRSFRHAQALHEVWHASSGGWFPACEFCRERGSEL